MNRLPKIEIVSPKDMPPNRIYAVSLTGEESAEIGRRLEAGENQGAVYGDVLGRAASAGRVVGGGQRVPAAPVRRSAAHRCRRVKRRRLDMKVATTGHD